MTAIGKDNQQMSMLTHVSELLDNGFKEILFNQKHFYMPMYMSLSMKNQPSKF